VCAVAIAVTDSRGAARPARAAVVVAVLAAPALVPTDRWIPLGLPDHTGTTVFLLVSALLIDRAPARRFTAPLLCVILCAGQLSDAVVRYVYAPAIVVVCGYRFLASRKTGTGDLANLLAAAASVPLALVARATMQHFGAYTMVAPNTQLVPVQQWSHSAAATWNSIRLLFGVAAPGQVSAGRAAVFGIICMLVAAAGILRILWRWRTARRAEQVLLVAIAGNLGAYLISALATGPNSPHDIVTVLPAGAVLGARAVVPARIASRITAFAVSGIALPAALSVLAAATMQPAAVMAQTQLSVWLRDHRLSYGLGGYWDASSVTVASGNQVQVRTITVRGQQVTTYPWDMNTAWFDPSRHYANFVVFNLVAPHLSLRAERIFGKPASTQRVGIWEILIYRKNLLTQVQPAPLPPTA